MRWLLSNSLPIVLVLAAANASAEAQFQIINPDLQTTKPSVAADSKGSLHTAYLSFQPGKDVPDVYYSKSKDSGATWTPGVNVSLTPGISDQPSITTSGDDVIVVWADTTSGEDRPDVYITRSTDGGGTWSKSVNVSKTPGESSQPTVCVSPNGVIHVAWRQQVGENGEFGVYYSQSLDQGKRWAHAQNISKMFGEASNPTLACDAKNGVLLAWAHKQKAQDNTDIWLLRSTDSGQTWLDPVDVSNSPGVSSHPSIALDSKGTVYLAWEDTNSEDLRPDIYATVSHDAGQSFEKPRDIAATPGMSKYPQVVAGSDGHVVVVWQDTPEGNESPDVWMAISGDAAKTFAAPKNVSSSPGVSSYPGVAIANNKAIALWEELDKDQKHVRAITVALGEDPHPAKKKKHSSAHGE